MRKISSHDIACWLMSHPAASALLPDLIRRLEQAGGSSPALTDAATLERCLDAAPEVAAWLAEERRRIVMDAAEEMMAIHAETFRKLAL